MGVEKAITSDSDGNMPLDRRDKERFPLIANAQCILRTGVPLVGRLLNISRGGCQVLANKAKLEPGEALTILNIGREEIGCHVTWVSGNKTGLKFDELINFLDIDNMITTRLHGNIKLMPEFDIFVDQFGRKLAPLRNLNLNKVEI